VRRAVRLDRRGHDDRAARSQPRHGRPSAPQHAVQVRPEDPVELLGGQRLDAVAVLLVSGVEYQDVEAAELLDRGLHDARGEVLVANVSRQGEPPVAGLLDQGYGVVRVDLLLGEVGDRHVGALPREGDGDGASDA